MKLFGVVEENVIVNIIVADSLAIAEEVTGSTCIESTEDNPIGIGWYFDNEENAYISPEPLE